VPTFNAPEKRFVERYRSFGFGRPGKDREGTDLLTHDLDLLRQAMDTPEGGKNLEAALQQTIAVTASKPAAAQGQYLGRCVRKIVAGTWDLERKQRRDKRPQAQPRQIGHMDPSEETEKRKLRDAQAQRRALLSQPRDLSAEDLQAMPPGELVEKSQRLLQRADAKRQQLYDAERVARPDLSPGENAQRLRIAVTAATVAEEAYRRALFLVSACAGAQN